MTPGRGFRWVRVGWYLRNHDEWFTGIHWVRVLSWGYKVDRNHMYRRRTATRKTKGRA